MVLGRDGGTHVGPHAWRSCGIVLEAPVWAGTPAGLEPRILRGEHVVAHGTHAGHPLSVLGIVLEAPRCRHWTI